MHYKIFLWNEYCWTKYLPWGRCRCSLEFAIHLPNLIKLFTANAQNITVFPCSVYYTYTIIWTSNRGWTWKSWNWITKFGSRMLLVRDTWLENNNPKLWDLTPFGVFAGPKRGRRTWGFPDFVRTYVSTLYFSFILHAQFTLDPKYFFTDSGPRI